MKRFAFTILLIAISSITFAGEGGNIVANVEKENPLIKKNTIFPPIIKVTYEYYEVCGCCETDLKCQLKQKCITGKDGKKYDAGTSWKVKWDYGHNRAGQTCSVDAFTVTLHIRYRLPKWARSDDAPKELVEKWEGYTKNLLLHESGHRDRAVEAAEELTRTIAELPPSLTCSDLDHEVNNLSRARMEKLEEDQKQYDIVTRHGATQGALFP